jgi:hypothetical protein
MKCFLEVDNHVTLLSAPPVTGTRHPGRVGSRLIYCPRCGRTWARLFDPDVSEWLADRWVCERCPSLVGKSEGPAPGTITGHYPGLDLLLPRELYLRDLELELRETERWLE